MQRIKIIHRLGHVTVILILITSQVHNQSVNVWSTVVIVSAQTLQTAVRKQTATAVIRET